MTTTQASAVIGYLVSTCEASASLGQASPQVYVFDGPQPSRALSGVQRALWIGSNPASDTEAGVTATQEFAGMDMGLKRNEAGEVVCAAQCWSGDTAIAIQRDGADAIVAAVELLLRGTPRSGGPGDTSMGGLVLWSQVSGPFEWYQRQQPNGASVLCVFRVSYRARLVT
jgi:hypothetical protein